LLLHDGRSVATKAGARRRKSRLAHSQKEGTRRSNATSISARWTSNGPWTTIHRFADDFNTVSDHGLEYQASSGLGNSRSGSFLRCPSAPCVDRQLHAQTRKAPRSCRAHSQRSRWQLCFVHYAINWNEKES
jgi:hypothetical protein